MVDRILECMDTSDTMVIAKGRFPETMTRPTMGVFSAALGICAV